MNSLRVLMLIGNPVLRNWSCHRKKLIISCKSLTYLNEAPVFDKDRRCAEAWKDGGLEAEQAMRATIENEEHQKTRDSVNALLRKRDEIRRMKLETAGETCVDEKLVEILGNNSCDGSENSMDTNSEDEDFSRNDSNTGESVSIHELRMPWQNNEISTHKSRNQIHLIEELEPGTYSEETELSNINELEAKKIINEICENYIAQEHTSIEEAKNLCSSQKGGGDMLSCHKLSKTIGTVSAMSAELPLKEENCPLLHQNPANTTLNQDDSSETFHNCHDEIEAECSENNASKNYIYKHSTKLGTQTNCVHGTEGNTLSDSNVNFGNLIGEHIISVNDETSYLMAMETETGVTGLELVAEGKEPLCDIEKHDDVAAKVNSCENTDEEDLMQETSAMKYNHEVCDILHGENKNVSKTVETKIVQSKTHSFKSDPENPPFRDIPDMLFQIQHEFAPENRYNGGTTDTEGHKNVLLPCSGDGCVSGTKDYSEAIMENNSRKWDLSEVVENLLCDVDKEIEFKESGGYRDVEVNEHSQSATDLPDQMKQANISDPSIGCKGKENAAMGQAGENKSEGQDIIYINKETGQQSLVELDSNSPVDKGRTKRYINSSIELQIVKMEHFGK